MYVWMWSWKYVFSLRKSFLSFSRTFLWMDTSNLSYLFNIGFWLHFFSFLFLYSYYICIDNKCLNFYLVMFQFPSRSTKIFPLYFLPTTELLTLTKASNWLLISSQFRKDKDFSPLLHLCIIFMNTKSSWRFLSSSIYL